MVCLRKKLDKKNWFPPDVLKELHSKPVVYQNIKTEKGIY
jgi:hypothetical protein